MDRVKLEKREFSRMLLRGHADGRKRKKLVAGGKRLAGSQGDAFAPIVEALETQIMQLDALGAHIAAAHLDAAIHQLRFEDLRDRLHADA